MEVVITHAEAFVSSPIFIRNFCERSITQKTRNYILMIEMQQYIDISPYHDTLGGDTVSIHI